MSKRKTRAQKIKTQERKEQEKIINREKQRLLQSLEEEKKSLRKEEKLRTKQFHLRNFRFFKNTCNFLMPFVLVAGISSGATYICNGGLPVHVDKVIKYKKYDLEYMTDNYSDYNYHYVENHWYNNALPTSSLTLYTPWEYTDGQYSRVKSEYKLGSVSPELYDAVINEDYQYIENALEKETEEKIIRNYISDLENDGCYIEASIHKFDKSDKLTYDETAEKNMIVTIALALISLLGGGFISHIRDFDFIYEIKEENNTYKLRVEAVKKSKEKIENIKNKIKTL